MIPNPFVLITEYLMRMEFAIQCCVSFLLFSDTRHACLRADRETVVSLCLAECRYEECENLRKKDYCSLFTVSFTILFEACICYRGRC